MKRICLLLTFALVGCGAAEKMPAAAPSAVAAAPTPAPAPPPASVTPVAKTEVKETSKAKNESRAPVVIYQGDLRMTADEEAIPKTIDRIVDIAEGLGGHIAGRKDTTVQIKVPSASFRDALTKIDELGGVVSRSVSADDVSEEFHDLEVRLSNLRTTRARLQEFMAKATNVNEMLIVEHELERIAQEVDRIEGRLEFLRTRAAMSTISVAFTAKPKPAAPIVVAPPAPHPVEVPIPWASDIGIDHVLSLKKKS